jgi:hypothetical protein
MANTETTLVADLEWAHSRPYEDDQLASCTIFAKTPYGIRRVRITVLDRMTGFGWRDVETGYCETDGRFWLASGDFDITYSPKLTVTEAIEKIKLNSNSNRGDYMKKSFPIVRTNHATNN